MSAGGLGFEIQATLTQEEAARAMRNEPIRIFRINGIEVCEYIGRKQVFKAEQKKLLDFKAVTDTCPRCSAVWKLNMDHVIPQDLLQQLGLSFQHYYIADNLEVMCERCNGYKSNKLDFSNPKTKPLLVAMLSLIPDQPHPFGPKDEVL